MLASAFDSAEPGELTVLVGIGQGVDAVLLRIESAAKRGQVMTRALSRKRDEPSYVRYLSHRGLLDVDFGMRAERDQRTAHTVAYRKRRAITAFDGGRCERCGTVQFPLSRVCVNPDCRATDTQVPHRLADSLGRVKTFTEDWQAYCAAAALLLRQCRICRRRQSVDGVHRRRAGRSCGQRPVRFVFRIKDEDRARGFRRYFWKATKV